MNNSINNNKHPRNIIKYYKMQFHRIPRLDKYKIIIWVDGTIKLHYDSISLYIKKLIDQKHNIVLFEHSDRNGTILDEIYALRFADSSYYHARGEPEQNFLAQYNDYLADGYNDNYWKSINNNHRFGLWSCTFMAFNMTSEIISFLDMWYYHQLRYTNRDQLSFPFVCFKQNIIPYTLPDNVIKGRQVKNTFYERFPHGL